MIEMDDEGCDAKFRQLFDYIHTSKLVLNSIENQRIETFSRLSFVTSLFSLFLSLSLSLSLSPISLIFQYISLSPSLTHTLIIVSDSLNSIKTNFCQFPNSYRLKIVMKYGEEKAKCPEQFIKITPIPNSCNRK
jgi:hypothetical protein